MFIQLIQKILSNTILRLHSNLLIWPQVAKLPLIIADLRLYIMKLLIQVHQIYLLFHCCTSLYMQRYY